MSLDLAMRARIFSVLGVLLVLVALPASASAQATRTWVSGVGDDANPCSRTAPCRSYEGAIPKTAAGGEIDTLDPGDFDHPSPLTITKSMTVTADGVTAGMQVTSGSSITINAPGDTVVINGLDINGQGTASSGIDVIAAKSVRVTNSDISGFTRAGIDLEPTTAGAHLVVDGTAIHDNGGDGVLVAPASGGSATAILNQDRVTGNACGIVAASLGVQATPDFGTNCGTNPSGSAGGSAQATSINSSISDNVGQGAFSNGGSAESAIGSDLITDNGAGLQVLNGGTILSLGFNEVYGNAVNGSATAISDAAAGSAGPNGASGPAGARGPTGSPGARGAAGKIELVACTAVTRTVSSHGKSHKINEQQCNGKLVAGSVKFTSTGAVKASASVSRAGRVYAVGSASIARAGTKLVLTSARRLKAGSYTLTLRRGRRLVGRESVDVG